jgi:peptidyl-dipeptidase A
MKILYCLPVLLCFLAFGCARRSPAEKALQSFIDAHVLTVEPLLKTRNLAEWNASVTGEKRYYDAQSETEMQIKRVYSNRNDFANLKEWKSSETVTDPLLSRQLDVLINAYLPNQIDTVLLGKIVEKGARIAETFNTFRGKIDGRSVDDNDIVAVLQTSRNGDDRRRAWEASKQVGEAVAPMVVELVKLRNEGARALGFENYFSMSMAAAEQNEDEVAALFDRLKRLTDESFRRMKNEIDAGLAPRCGIGPAQMQPWHYMDRFFQEPQSSGGVDLDVYFRGRKIDEIAARFYRGMGLPCEAILAKSDLFGRPGKYQHAFCADIDRKGDIRVISSITDSHWWAGTLLHELGHGVYDRYIRRDLPFLLREPAHALTTEAVAQMMERQADSAGWLMANAGAGENGMETLGAALAGREREKLMIFCRWSLVMFHFEREMYRNPGRDLNRLWWDMVEQYQFVKRPGGRNKPDWAAKIHLAQYPAYYHNYLLGELAACQLRHTIARSVLKQEKWTTADYTGKSEVGAYLRSELFGLGTALPWNELMKKATGESLTPDYFAEAMMGESK